VKEDEMGMTYSMHGRGVPYRVLIGKHEGKIPLGRHTCRLENNIKIYLGEIG
jgi:hypothetical protein